MPIISVGNLEVGGAGKSPMTEYLIRLFKVDHKLATLSRGYGRKTKGFIKIQNSEFQTPGSRLRTQDSRLSSIIGDEPAQFAQKFPDITVAVCEDRAEGIKRLFPDHDLILMDDAYQHRAVEPGLSILLFDYSRVKQPYLLLPAGNFREPMSGRWRAQVVIITKCPATLSNDEMTDLAYRIQPLPYQQLFFTSTAYQPLKNISSSAEEIHIDKDTTMFLLTGIANPNPLIQYLNNMTPHIIHHKYPDHHPFTLKNITKLADEYDNCTSQKKIIVTTEKDAQRLDVSWLKSRQLPVYVIPISVEFLNGMAGQFDKIVIDYVREHTKEHSIH